jgi:hypothetical protein
LASFDPQVPGINPPDWTKVSKPVQQPESITKADTSLGTLLKTGGEVLEGGAALALDTKHEELKNQITEDVNKSRENWINTYAQLIPGQQAPSLVDAPQPDAPGNVKAGMDRIRQLAIARDQNGHVNDTQYTMEIYAQLKKLRAANPGFVNYIDDQYKQISGIDPANATMRNLMEDINRNSANTKSEQDKAISLGRQWFGYDPHMPAYVEAVRRGLPNAIQNLEAAVNKAASEKVRFDTWDMQHRYSTAIKADDALEAQDQYRAAVTASAYKWQNGVYTLPGLTNPTTIAKLIADDQNGINPLTDTQKVALQQALQQAELGWKQEAINIQNGKGKFATRIQDQKVVDSITAGAGQWFTAQLANIQNDKTGAMFANNRRLASIQDDQGVQALSDKDIGKYLSMSAIFQKFGGPVWANEMMGRFLGQGGYGKFTNFLEDVNRRAQVPDDLRKDGVVKSMYDDIQKARQYAVDNAEAIPQKVYNNIVDNVNIITNPKAPDNIKAEVVKYAFKPKNWSIMNQFGTDFTDDQGVQHKGKNSVFDTMTSPKVTEGIWKLHDNEAWGNYKNWAEQSFNRIYSGEIKTLNGISQDQSIPVKVSWDADNRRFSLAYGRKPQTDIEANYIKNSQAVVQRLNSGLSNLARVQDHEGQDTSAYLIDSLLAQGFHPGMNVGGLPQKIYDAIKSSSRTNRIEDAYKAGQ